MELILDRIKLIMEKEGISPSSLADKVGISRPLMSHVMSGRNKPSLQLVLRILEHFPAYSANWLLMGKEEPVVDSNSNEMPMKEESSSVPSPKPVQNNHSASTEYEGKQSDSEQVIIFHADKTYSVYKPR